MAGHTDSPLLNLASITRRSHLLCSSGSFFFELSDQVGRLWHFVKKPFLTTHTVGSYQVPKVREIELGQINPLFYFNNEPRRTPPKKALSFGEFFLDNDF